MTPTTMSARDHFTRTALEQNGFVGWSAVRDLAKAAAKIDRTAGGVYIVYRATAADVAFLLASPAGRFRGDPTVPLVALEANWVPDANVLYIGKADSGRLRQRLRELEGFGRGTRHRHSGGRLIWQLRDSADLLVAWKTIARGSPRAVEAELLGAFRAAYSHAPFANDPHLLGS